MLEPEKLPRDEWFPRGHVNRRDPSAVVPEDIHEIPRKQLCAHLSANAADLAREVLNVVQIRDCPLCDSRVKRLHVCERRCRRTGRADEDGVGLELQTVESKLFGEKLVLVADLSTRPILLDHQDQDVIIRRIPCQGWHLTTHERTCGWARG